MRYTAAAPSMAYVFTIDVALQPPIVLTESPLVAACTSPSWVAPSVALGFRPRSSPGAGTGRSNASAK